MPPPPRPRAPRRSSAKDVARLAGVSTATVSRVINTPGQVDADTQRLVRDGVKMVERGYRQLLRARRRNS